jgi:choline monooxygenase
MSGIQNFSLSEMGLKPLRVAVWGPFVLLKVTAATSRKGEVETDELVASEWLGTSVGRLSQGGVDSPLSYICRREYTIDCNWKVKSCSDYIPF